MPTLNRWIISLSISCAFHMALLLAFFLTVVSIKLPHEFLEVKAYFREESTPKNCDLVTVEENTHKAKAIVFKKPQRASHQPIIKRAKSMDGGATDGASGGQELKPNPNAMATNDVVTREFPLLMNEKDVIVPYPAKAKSLHVQGIVRLELTVSRQGHVVKAKVLAGPDFGLHAAALLVAYKLVFLPATDKDGIAQIKNIRHEVVFKLQKSREEGA